MTTGPGPDGNVYVVAAARTPIGRFGGALAGVPATELGGVAIRAAVERVGLDPATAEIDEVLMGQVLQAGAGQAPARQAALAAGLREETPATTINRVCGSGLKAIMLALRHLNFARTSGFMPCSQSIWGFCGSALAGDSTGHPPASGLPRIRIGAD